MKTVYRLNKEDYKPISYRESYLYEQHQRIISFLKSRLDNQKVKKILKPKLVGGMLEWQGDFEVEMSLIEHASSKEKVAIEKEYLELIDEIEKLTKRMINSGDSDQVEWANFLTEVFSVENNKILFNGSEWAFIWGWEFKSKLTILDPDFVGIPDPTPDPEIPDPTPDPPIPEPAPPIPEPAPPIADPAPPIADPVSPIADPVPSQTVVEKRRLTFFEYIKRFLRWIAYRFWALMLLILVVLLILCMCRHCCAPEFDCSGIDKELGLLEGRLECCCNDEISVPETPDNVENVPVGDNNYPCDVDAKSGSDGITENRHYFQNSPPGNVTLIYDMASEPDKLEVFHNGALVASTTSIPGNEYGFIGDDNNGGCCGSLSFYYSAQGDKFCLVVVTGGNGTSWNYTLGCPQ